MSFGPKDHVPEVRTHLQTPSQEVPGPCGTMGLNILVSYGSNGPRSCFCTSQTGAKSTLGEPQTSERLEPQKAPPSISPMTQRGVCIHKQSALSLPDTVRVLSGAELGRTNPLRWMARSSDRALGKGSDGRRRPADGAVFKGSTVETWSFFRLGSNETRRTT